MIDPRRPLEGVPGLLLLAALVLFGATIGIALALMFSWVAMKDSLANFLGGVVGAGLGSALAVFGSVYLYERGRREDRAPMLAELHATLGNVIRSLQATRRHSSVRQATMIDVALQATVLSNLAAELFVSRYLPKPIHAASEELRERILEVSAAINAYIATPTEVSLPTPEELDRVIQLGENVLAHVEALE